MLRMLLFMLGLPFHTMLPYMPALPFRPVPCFMLFPLRLLFVPAPLAELLLPLVPRLWPRRFHLIIMTWSRSFRVRQFRDTPTAVLFRQLSLYDKYYASGSIINRKLGLLMRRRSASRNTEQKVAPAAAMKYVMTRVFRQ